MTLSLTYQDCARRPYREDAEGDKKHKKLQGLSDEEFYSLVKSEVFDIFCVDHLFDCRTCKERFGLLEKRWGMIGGSASTPFLQELHRLEKEILSKRLHISLGTEKGLLEHAFRIKATSSVITK